MFFLMQESSVETESKHWPELLGTIIQELTKGCQYLSLDELEEAVLLCSKLLSKLTPSTNFVRETSLPRGIASPGLSPTSSEFDHGDSIEYDSKTFEDSMEKGSPRDSTDQSLDSFESRDSFDPGDVIMGARADIRSRDQELGSREVAQESRVLSRGTDKLNNEAFSSEVLEQMIGERFRTPKFEKSKGDINNDDLVDGSKLPEKGKDGKTMKESEGKSEKENVEEAKRRERVSDKRKIDKVKEKANELKEKRRSKKEKSRDKQRAKEKSKKDREERPTLVNDDTKSVKSNEDKKNEESLKYDSQSMLVRKCIDHFMNFILEFFKWKIFRTEKAMDILSSGKFSHIKDIDMRDRGVSTCAGHVHCSCSSPTTAAKTYAAMCKLLVELSCFPMQDKGTELDGLPRKGKN